MNKKIIIAVVGLYVIVGVLVLAFIFKDKNLPGIASPNRIVSVSVKSGVDMPTGQRPFLRATGPDENIYADYYCKGACAHVFRGWDGGAHAFVAFAQSPLAQNFIEAHGTVGPPELRATGPVGNVDLMLRPQKEGVVLARNAVKIITIAPDGTQQTIGYIGAHKAIFGGDSDDLVIKAESGKAIRFFIGDTEKRVIQ